MHSDSNKLSSLGVKFPWLFICGFGVAALTAAADSRALHVMAPMIAMSCVCGLFWNCLARRDGRLPIFEIGSFAILAAAAYGILPLLWYLLSGMELTPLSHRRLLALDPTPEDFERVGWDYFFYIATFAVTYIGLRKSSPSSLDAPLETKSSDALILLALVVILRGVFLALQYGFGINPSAAYDESIYESHDAYAALPLLARQLIDWAQGLLVVVNCAFILVLIANWRSVVFRWILIIWFSATIILYVLAPGSRFILLAMLLAAGLSYERLVKRIRLSYVAMAMLVLFLSFILAGVFRSAGDLKELNLDANNLVAGAKLFFSLSNEFQIGYGSVLELDYLTRSDFLPSPPWQVYASELLLLIPSQLLPFDKVDPVIWYTDATADPDYFTFGVVAQSLLGLGLVELILRGAAIAAALATVHNWWARRPTSLWRNVFYVWLSIVVYYSIRNTSFYVLTLVMTRFMPVAAFFWVVHFASSKLQSPTGEGRS